jgi:hypothetical protein
VELVRCLAPSVGLGGSDVLERGLLLFDLLAGAFEVGACDLGLRHSRMLPFAEAVQLQMR